MGKDRAYTMPCGAKRASKCPRSSPSEPGSGAPMGRASGCGSAAQSCLVVRIHGKQNARRATLSDTPRMSGLGGGETPGLAGGEPAVGGALSATRRASPHSIGQWARVHRPQVAPLAEDAAGRAPSSPARPGRTATSNRSMANAGPVSQWRAVLHAQGREKSDPTVADTLQYGPTAQRSRGPATRSRNPPAGELRTDIDDGTKTPDWSKFR